MVSIPVYSEHCVKNNVQCCFYTRMWSTEIQCMSLNVDFIFKIYHVFDRDTMYNIKVLILFSEPIMFFTDTVYNIKVFILFPWHIVCCSKICH